ncbi:MAG: hypothetical protein KDN19_08395 [Verrucomicrobiae bacterium]|nr:hypothetical protein [Verrucomicrobiae bacterium]
MSEEDSRLKDITDLSYHVSGRDTSKVRTQIYLSEAQRDFLNRESKRTGFSMAELIRHYIEEKMNPNEDIWEANSLLAPAPEDPDFEGHEDGSVNTDAIIYGSFSE